MLHVHLFGFNQKQAVFKKLFEVGRFIAMQQTHRAQTIRGAIYRGPDSAVTIAKLKTI